MAIYKAWRKTNPSSGREEDFNPGPLDYKSSTLTTRSRCLLQYHEKVMQMKFEEIRGFSGLFDEKNANFHSKRIWDKNLRHFEAPIVFNLKNFQTIIRLLRKLTLKVRAKIRSIRRTPFENSRAKFALLSLFSSIFQQENLLSSKLPRLYFQLST